MVSESHYSFCSLHTPYVYRTVFCTVCAYACYLLYLYVMASIHSPHRLSCVDEAGKHSWQMVSNGVYAESNALCNWPINLNWPLVFLFAVISQVSRADIRAPSVGDGHCKWRNPVVQAYGTSGDKSHAVKCTFMDCSWYKKSSSLFTPPIIIPGYNNQRRSGHLNYAEMYN